MGRTSIAAERRDQIVWALYRCLCSSNYDQVSIKQIASEARVQPGIVHHYFASKNEIYASLAIGIREHYEELLDRHLDQHADQDGHYEATLAFIVDRFILDRSLNRVFYNLVQMSLDNEAVRLPLQGLLNRYRHRLQEEFPTGRSGPVIVAQIEGLALQHMVDPNRFSRAQFLSMLDGLLATPTPEKQP